MICIENVMDSIEMAGIEERRWTQHGVERKRNFKQYACDKNIFGQQHMPDIKRLLLKTNGMSEM